MVGESEIIIRKQNKQYKKKENRIIFFARGNMD